MRKVVFFALVKIILHLWNKEIQINNIIFILHKFNEYLLKTILKICRFLTISDELQDVTLNRLSEVSHVNVLFVLFQGYSDITESLLL